jgi:SAM-dependent methyltransferase
VRGKGLSGGRTRWPPAILIDSASRSDEAVGQPDTGTREVRVSDVTLENQLGARAAGDYADFLLPYLGKKTHLLDCGCGDGVLSAGLANVCGRVTALDVAPADGFPVSAASRRRDDVTFFQGDATQLPFRDRTFDALLAHSVLESGVEPDRLLAEAWRVLRPGGVESPIVV